MTCLRIDWTWAFVLEPTSARTTRFVFRSRFWLTPAWVRALYLGLIVPADFVMARQMMRGLKSRVESANREAVGAW